MAIATAIKGRKGGSSSSRTPTEQPDDLQSVAKAKILLALGEGEFAGGLTARDIYLDGTALENADGSQNFSGVAWEFRSGTQAQKYIQGIPGTENEINVGSEVSSTTAWTRTFTNTQLSAVRLRLKWPSLFKQEDDGDLVGYSVNYAIDMQTDGGTWQTVLNTSVTGKTTSGYERSHRIDLPQAGSTWTIRLRKITADANSAKIGDTMTLQSFTEVMTTLEEMSPRVEIYSIDEAFCDLAGVRNCRDLTDFGKEIRATVLKRTHLTVGVGIAQTKTLAKLANHAAKKWQRQTGGVVDLSNIDRQRRLLSIVPVEDVWGVGRRISKKLNAMGIKTALDLSEQSTWIIRKHFNVVLERTVRELRGESCLELEEFAPAKQEIVCSRSFGERVTEYEQMRQAICSYAARGAEKLRGEHQYCRFISAFVKTSPFALNEPYYGNSASMKLLTPTQDSRDIINAAVKCLDKIWKDGHRYQKAGIMLGDFFSHGVAQLNLFDENAPRAGSERLMEVLDYLNAKDGKGTLYFAGQGIQQQWQMKRDMLSPRYTTRYSDLIKVR